MKRNRLLCLPALLLALALPAPGAAAQTPNAARSTTAIVVNDRPEVLYGYNIGGSNYYRLRDVAALLAGTSSRFSVDFNAATGRVLLTAGADYQPPRGSRLPDFPSDETPRRVSTPIELDGVRLDLDAYNIGGNSYFKLRDLGQALSFYVAWDGRAIYLDSKPPEGSVRMLSPFPLSGYDNRLTARYPRWAAAPTSFLAARETGGFHGVVVRGDRLDLFALDPWYRLQGTSGLPLELRLFGTFYSGRDHYYLVFGQSNQSQQDDREIIRISRYTKQFEKVDSLSLTGAQLQSTEPFAFGACRLAERAGQLTLHTARLCYKNAEGLNYQAQLTAVVDTARMQAVNPLGARQDNDMQNAFDQFVAYDGEVPVLVDHGSGLPRAVMLHKGKGPGSYTAVSLLDIPGDKDAHATGVSVGGLAVTDSHYLVPLSSVDHSLVREYGQQSLQGDHVDQRNLLLCALPRSLDGPVEQRRIATYVGSATTPSTPYLVQLSGDRLLLLWQEFSALSGDRGDMRALLLAADGSPVGDAAVLPGYALSDCAPIATGDNLVLWMAEAHGVTTVYRLQANF